MQPRTPKWLNDIASECALIRQATTGRSLVDYLSDQMLQHGIERCFEIIGEAMLRIEHTDPDIALMFTDHRKITGFRKRLAHGYDDIRDEQVWSIIQDYVPSLEIEAHRLLDSLDSSEVD